MTDPVALAAELQKAVDTATPISQLSSKTALDLDGAYTVQAAGIDVRTGRGEVLVGLKLGFTSAEKAEQMGVHDVIIGVLTDTMQIGDTEPLDLDTLVHPRIEPEVAFLLAPDVDELDLSDPEVELLDHVTHVAAAVEIIDSRYRDFRFELSDVVADNTSAARFRVGEWRAFSSARDRLGTARVELSENESVLASGSTDAILGDPLRALAAVQRMASRYRLRLPSSAIVLAGAATAAVAMRPASVYEAMVDGLGSVEVQTRAQSDGAPEGPDVS